MAPGGKIGSKATQYRSGLGPDASRLRLIERVGVLVKAKVPAFFIHVNDDKVVLIKENSAEFVARYDTAGAKDEVKLVVAKGQGHNYWEGFFRCPELIEFAIARAQSEATVL